VLVNVQIVNTYSVVMINLMERPMTGVESISMYYLTCLQLLPHEDSLVHIAVVLYLDV
jgi:hypothetical protein